jgi:hypothetical protein
MHQFAAPPHLLSRYRTLLLSRRLDHTSQLHGNGEALRGLLLAVGVGREREFAELRPGLNVTGLTRLPGPIDSRSTRQKGARAGPSNSRTPRISLVLDSLKRALSAAVPEWHTSFRSA